MIWTRVQTVQTPNLRTSSLKRKTAWRKIGKGFALLSTLPMAAALTSGLRRVKGRLKFGDSENSAPFPSAVVVFDASNQQQIFGAMNR